MIDSHGLFHRSKYSRYFKTNHTYSFYIRLYGTYFTMGCIIPYQSKHMSYIDYYSKWIIAGIPYDTVDPFIIHELPDVYVVGNQPSYEVGRREIGGKEIILIALPSFASTGMVSMINLRTLDVNSMNFNVDSIETTSMEIEEEKEEEEDVVIDEDIANDEEYYVYYKQTNKWLVV